jgi:hypothetical protein
MAVAAAAVAWLFVGLLVVLAGSAFFGKRPLIMPELLVLPVIGVVLAFAARRMIRNSEGTRAGEGLANAAWWAALVGGLAYAAYLFGLDPARRGTLNPDDPARLQAEFRTELLLFEQCDLVRLAGRNVGACEYVPKGLKDWAYKPTGIDCVFTGVLKCPEGAFPLDVALKGVEGVTGAEGGAARQWTVVNGQNGFFQPETVRRTPYGWLVTALELSGSQAGRNFIAAVSGNPHVLPYAYAGMIREPFPQGLTPGAEPGWVRTVVHTRALGAVAGGLAAARPFTNEYAAYFPDQFFKLRGGADPRPEQKKLFLDAWSTFGLAPPGGRLQNSPDTQPILTISDSAVEIRVPCELPIPGSDASAARGRVVLECRDPAVLEELKRLRAAANPDAGTAAGPEELANRVFNWRVVRFETDLFPVRPSADRVPAGGMPG